MVKQNSHSLKDCPKVLHRLNEKSSTAKRLSATEEIVSEVSFKHLRRAGVKSVILFYLTLTEDERKTQIKTCVIKFLY